MSKIGVVKRGGWLVVELPHERAKVALDDALEIVGGWELVEVLCVDTKIRGACYRRVEQKRQRLEC